MFYAHKFSSFLVFILFLLLSLLYFWQLFTPQNVDRRYLTNDFNHYYNLVNFVKNEESFPWWTSYRFQGLPVFAQMDLGLAYPPMIILLLIGKWLQLNSDNFFQLLEFYTVIHVAIAGLGAYIFTKRLGFSFYSSLLSGIAFMLSGIIIENINAFPLHVSFVWFPLVFAFYVDFLKNRRWQDYLATVLIMAMSLLGGILQVAVLYTFMLLFVYLLFYLITADGRKEKRDVVIFTFLIPVLAVLICAFQIIPAYELTSLSNRAALNYEHTAWTGHVKPRNMIDFFIPYFFSAGYGEGYVDVVVKHPVWNYLGVLPIIFTLLSMFFYRKKEILFFIIAALIFMFLSFGGFSFFHDLSFLIMPLGNKFRNVAKYQYIVSFCLAVLAGYSFDQLIKNNNEKFSNFTKGFISKYAFLLTAYSFYLFYLYVYLDDLWDLAGTNLSNMLFISNKLNLSILFILFSAISLFILIMLLDQLKSKWFLFLILVFVFIDLAHYGKFVKPNNGRINPANVFYEHSGIINFLKEDKDIFRIDYKGDAFVYNYLPEKFQINNIGGYSPFILQSVTDMLQLKSKYPMETEEYSYIAGLMGLKYIVSASLFDSMYFELVHTEEINGQNSKYYYTYINDLIGLVPRSEGSKLYIYKNKNFVSEAFFVNDYIVEYDGKEQLDIIKKLISDKSLFDIIVLEKKPSIDIPNTQMVGVIDLIDFSNNKITYTVDVPQNTLLYINEAYYPGWKAYIDGIETELLKANYAYRAVPVNAGSHKVEIVYHPRFLLLGVIISLSTLIALLLLVKFISKKQIWV